MLPKPYFLQGKSKISCSARSQWIEGPNDDPQPTRSAKRPSCRIQAPKAPKSCSENHIFYKENRKFHVLLPHDICSCYAKMCTAPQRELHFEIRGKKVQNRMLPKPYFFIGKSKILLYEQTFANTAIASLCGQAHTDEAPQQRRDLQPHAFTSAGARFSLKMSTPSRRDAGAAPDPHQQ